MVIDVRKALVALFVVAGYFACGITLSSIVGANELSLTWWVITLAWPVVVSVFAGIAFACVAAIALVVAIMRAVQARYLLSRQWKTIE